MLIEYARFIESLSIAIDFVEAEILKIKPYHGKRVAAIANLIGKAYGMNKDELFALTCAGLLHDCALTEYLKDEFGNGGEVTEKNMAAHCIAGERIVEHLPYYDLVKEAVLCHHERADGEGALGLTPEKTPLPGQIMHFADMVDVKFLQTPMTREKFEKMLVWVRKNTGTSFDKTCANLFSKVITEEFFTNLTEDAILPYIHSLLPQEMIEVSPSSIMEISAVFGIITDYKSEFTRKHSIGVAEKAYQMSEYYKWGRSISQKLYVAGALHDIGKLTISNSILEKPGRLSPEEYAKMQHHAMGTYQLLKDIGGLEEITSWASKHHEKLNGTGYPFGYKADDLSKEERLLAVLDIYQALIENRPYKNGMPHSQAVSILQSMADAGELDAEIVADVNTYFAA